MNGRSVNPLLVDLERLLRDRGAQLVACADLRPLAESVRHGLPVGVCIGVILAAEIVAKIENGPTITYAAECDRVNARFTDMIAPRLLALPQPRCLSTHFVKWMGFEPRMKATFRLSKKPADKVYGRNRCRRLGSSWTTPETLPAPRQ